MKTNIKDLLITQTAQQLQWPEGWVDRVVNFQFRSAAQALHRVGEVEISGFGRFIISQPKLKRRLSRHQEILCAITQGWEGYTETEKTGKEKKLQRLHQDLHFYHTHLKA